MDPELRGQLEVVADEMIEDLAALASVETDIGPISVEYALGMFEIVVFGP